MKENYYDILEVSSHASYEVIEKAYRVLVKKYHPDNNENNEEYSKKLILINEAYDVLCDEIKRAKYDKRLLDEKLKNEENEFNEENDDYDENSSDLDNDNDSYINVLREYKDYLDDLKRRERWERGEYTKDELKRIKEYGRKKKIEKFYLNIKISFYLIIFLLVIIAICMLPPIKKYIYETFLQNEFIKTFTSLFSLK